MDHKTKICGVCFKLVERLQSLQHVDQTSFGPAVEQKKPENVDLPKKQMRPCVTLDTG